MKMKATTKFSNAPIAITIIHFFVLFTCSYGSINEYGILAAESLSTSETENFCIVFFKDFAELPDSKSKAESDMLQDDSDIDWCEDHSEKDRNKKVSIAALGNCSVATQALNIQNQGAKAIFFIGSRDDYDLNVTDAQFVNITVGLMSNKTANRLKEMGDSILVKMFYIKDAYFDFSLLLMFTLAMFTVTTGAFWSGRVQYELRCNEMKSLPRATTQPVSSKVVMGRAEESFLNISPTLVVSLVTCMVLMLVSLYFLYEYLVYFMITIFVLASIVAVYSCLIPLVLKIPGNFCKYVFRCGSHSWKADFRHILLICFAIGISVFWVIIRKEKYAWILQDTLGIAFCIHMLKSIRLGSLKICTILLGLLFVYDVFFVFITPFFTSKGKSVMEEVATGGSNSEMLPMLLRVTHFRSEPMTACYEQFSILGFGDILVPGLVVSYCYGFDLITGTKRIYFLTTVAAYGIGMLITFMALFLMSTAQPALLYLVPCVLIPPILVGWCRGELPTLWTGFVTKKSADGSSYPEVQVTASNPPQGALAAEPALPTLTTYAPKDPTNVPEGSQGVTEEKNYLLQ